MSSDTSRPHFTAFAVFQYKKNRANLLEWSQQTSNPLLQNLALEIITVAESAGGSQ